MAVSPKITTWSPQEIKQFGDWCQTHQPSQMSGQEQWNFIAQCFPQDTVDVMEKIFLGKRGEENQPRLLLHSLQLTEITRSLKSSAPDVGSGYNKSDTLAGNLVTHEDVDPRNSISSYRRAEGHKSNYECVPRRHQRGHRYRKWWNFGRRKPA